MSPKSKQFYEFADFRLDVSEKVLLRGDNLIPLTPKVFETLQVLVENAGHLLAKDELMQKLWQDRFVEESNLTSNVKMLRKALGDDTANPRFIETVPRRGYRFIADVRKKVKEIVPAQANPQNAQANWARPKIFLIPAAALIIGTIIFGFWYVRSVNLNTDAPILSAPFALETLTTNGKTMNAVISPDGKNVVYTQGTGSDKQSVWLRQLETGNNVEIIPPSDDFYYGLALSPDGNFLYFVRRQRLQEGRFDIYRVSIFGGIPQKILSQAEGWISISPDGERISFVRCASDENEYCSLFVADSADGRNEQKILSRPRPFRIRDNRFSPDGNYIAFAVGQSETAANEVALMEIEIETRTERALTDQKFFNVRNLAWLPDGGGLLFTASQIPNTNYRIWQVSRTTRESAPLTKDSESYSTLSLDGRANQIVSTQIKEDFRLSLFQTENPLENRILADATSVVFAVNGKIFFTSMLSGNKEIWSMNADGGGRRQLTNNPADESSALSAPDGNSIFFASNRTGEVQIWKMSADGSDQTQITHKEGGTPLLVSPDGRWLFYHHSLHKTLWRVPSDGGEEQLVLDKRKHQLALSPDGSQAAFREAQGAENILMIVSLENGQTVKTFKLADERSELVLLKWSADGANLMYISTVGENGNKILWRQPLAGDAPQKIANLGSEYITGTGFALAPDNKTFAIAQGTWRHDAVLLKGLK